MIIAIGTTNPAKISAVEAAITGKLEDYQLVGFEVASGIPEQPLSDEETRQGARNRAFAALEAARQEHSRGEVELAVGLEGGVFPFEGVMWSTVWICVVDASGEVYEANGARFPLPERVSKLLQAGGELGPIMHELTGQADVSKKQGAYGVISKGFFDRTQAYAAIATVAFGQWYGRGWDQGLSNEA